MTLCQLGHLVPLMTPETQVPPNTPVQDSLSLSSAPWLPPCSLGLLKPRLGLWQSGGMNLLPPCPLTPQRHLGLPPHVILLDGPPDTVVLWKEHEVETTRKDLFSLQTTLYCLNFLMQVNCFYLIFFLIF